jgi:hypothetical protein
MVAWVVGVRALVFVGPVLTAGFVAGCGGSAVSDPSSAMRAYVRALEDGRAEDAYRLLSDEARRSVPFETWKRLFRDHPEELKEVARNLGRPTGPAAISAKVVTPSGEEVDLVFEEGQWRVEANALDLYAQDTPRRAAIGFLRALERRRYDVLLRFVPDAHRDGLDEAKLRAAWEGDDKESVARVAGALRQALPTATVEQTGDRATLPYGSGTLMLVRERGIWKIEDFD